jgi:uracil-DNA glycosylase
MKHLIPGPWLPGLKKALDSESFVRLCDFLAREKAEGRSIFPEERNLFKAFDCVPPDRVRVVILGQDPYHGENQAMGLSFAVPNALKPKPPSLKNILKELRSDLGVNMNEDHSDLTGWANQGVLLLNTVLSVRAHEPLSHQNQGWEDLTDQALLHLNEQKHKIVFVLWGGHAQKKRKLLQSKHHEIIETPHPSPLSAYRGFFGSKVFSRINQVLQESGSKPIEWTRLTEL